MSHRDLLLNSRSTTLGKGLDPVSRFQGKGTPTLLKRRDSIDKIVCHRYTQSAREVTEAIQGSPKTEESDCIRIHTFFLNFEEHCKISISSNGLRF